MKGQVRDRHGVLGDVIAAAGSITELVAAIKKVTADPAISVSSVSRWRRIPAHRCLEIEAITGISRYRLRPDIYGPAPKRGNGPRRGLLAAA